jgi:hypothetical protein
VVAGARNWAANALFSRKYYIPCQTISLFALTWLNSLIEGFAETFMVAIHLDEQFRHPERRRAVHFDQTIALGLRGRSRKSKESGSAATQLGSRWPFAPNLCG